MFRIFIQMFVEDFRFILRRFVTGSSVCSLYISVDWGRTFGKQEDPYKDRKGTARCSFLLALLLLFIYEISRFTVSLWSHRGQGLRSTPDDSARRGSRKATNGPVNSTPQSTTGDKCPGSGPVNNPTRRLRVDCRFISSPSARYSTLIVGSASFFGRWSSPLASDPFLSWRARTDHHANQISR